MANATSRVPMSTTPWGDDAIKRVPAATATTFYPGAMVAIDSGDNAVHCDNTAGIRFDGINANTARLQINSDDTVAAMALDQSKQITVERPWRFTAAIAAAAAGDVGKALYAADDQTVSYSQTASIFVGWVDMVLSATLVLVRPAWAGQSVGGVVGFDGATLTFTGATGANTLVMPDNLADALSVVEGSNAYVTFVTTNGSESINVKKTVLFPGATGTNLIKMTDNLADALSIQEGGNKYVTFVTTDSGELIDLLKTVRFGGATGANLIRLVDNLASALDVTEASNSYLKFITSNSAESIVFGKALTQAVGASTAAAGSSTSDAGALPAGTASVYPTTAADDTKGVILSTVDKVTGRAVVVGNGVSNKILKVYPPSGGTINGAAADAAFSSASGKGVFVVCLSGSGNTWLAM